MLPFQCRDYCKIHSSGHGQVALKGLQALILAFNRGRGRWIFHDIGGRERVPDSTLRKVSVLMGWQRLAAVLGLLRSRPRRQIGIVVEDRAEGEISQAQAGACRQGAVKRRRPDRPVLGRVLIKGKGILFSALM